jgi:hypothetical protein
MRLEEVGESQSLIKPSFRLLGLNLQKLELLGLSNNLWKNQSRFS